MNLCFMLAKSIKWQIVYPLAYYANVKIVTEPVSLIETRKTTVSAEVTYVLSFAG